MYCVFIIISVSKMIFWKIRDGSKCFSGRFPDGGEKKSVLTPGVDACVGVRACVCRCECIHMWM